MRRCYLLIMLLLYSGISSAADPLLVARIIVCESRSRINVCHADVDDALYGPSCGIAQFKKPTFEWMAKMAIKQGAWDWNLGRPSWMDYKQQVLLLNWALDNGLGWNWTCWHMIKGEVK